MTLNTMAIMIPINKNANDILPAGYFLKSAGRHDISVEQAETFCEGCIDIVKNEAISKHPALTGSDAIEDVMVVATVDSDETPSTCDRCGCPIECAPFGTFDLITTYGEWMAVDEAQS